MFHRKRNILYQCFSGVIVALCLTPLAQAAEVPGQVLIFVSFSMPLTSLQQWAAQAQSIHAPLIVRGLVQDSFPDTQQKVAELSAHPSYGVVIDPRLFREYSITQVPAVVVRDDMKKPCPSNQTCWQNQRFDVVIGDVGLESALQAIADQGEHTVNITRQLLAEYSHHAR